MKSKSNSSVEPNRYLISYNEEIDKFNILFGNYDEETGETKVDADILISSNDMKKFYASLTLKGILYELESKNDFFKDQMKYIEEEIEDLKLKVKEQEVD